MSAAELHILKRGLEGGSVVPYLGPGVLALSKANSATPAAPEVLVQRLVAKASVPHKIRNNLTAAAQFVENFKHRKTVVSLMQEAFSVPVEPTALHQYLAGLAKLPLIVDVWYDAAMALALQQHNSSWGQIQGLSQAEHFGQWTQAYRPDGTAAEEAEVARWKTLLYKPQGSIAPASNFLVSDSDYVEVLTEIDIQTPIPAAVQQRRSCKSFLFLGCRFANQLERTFARQITKRASSKHWAVLPDAPTKSELRFLGERNIQRIDMPLAEFVALLTASDASTTSIRAATA
mgnify:CR=1 FL=1